MSGGSYDYLYWKVEDAARKLMSKAQPNYRQAFGDLLLRCAKALHDVEWVDSDDMSEGDDKDSIMECIDYNDVLKFTIQQAIRIKEDLDSEIERAANTRCGCK